ncbi:MAG TPA: PEP-CTERM sorting domain-containing protein [Phycisphaeraceae bacterium]
MTQAHGILLQSVLAGLRHSFVSPSHHHERRISMLYRLTVRALILGGMLAVAPAASADTIALWNFDDGALPQTDVAGSELADVGTGSVSWTATSLGTPVGNGTAHSWSLREFDTTGATPKGIDFTVGTVGRQDIVLSFSMNAGSTSPQTFSIQWATSAGGPFTQIDQITLLQTAFVSTTFNPDLFYSFDLSAVTALNDAPTAVFRIIQAEPATNNLGSVRLDEVHVEGSPLPEPASSLLMALGAVAVVTRQRRAHR